MQNGPPPSSLSAVFNNLCIIHFALLSAVVVYGVVGHIVSATPRDVAPPSLASLQGLLVALSLVALTLVAVQPFLRSRFQPPRRPRRTADDTLPAEPFPPAGQNAMARWLTSQILSWSLTESIAVMGLVLVLVTCQPWIYYPFGGVALVQLLRLAPTREDLEGVVRAALGRSGA